MSDASLSLLDEMQISYGHLVDRVIDRMGGEAAHRVFKKVSNGEAQLWDDGHGGVVITQVTEEVDGLVCTVWMGAGELLPLLSLHESLVAWACSIGCSKMRITGRAGWVRVLPGYRETARVFEMPLGDRDGQG